MPTKRVFFHLAVLLAVQVANISTIKDAMREASHLYAELSLLGAPMGLLDVGGGLGVDYDGTRGSPISVNYSMQNYANDVVAAVHDACLQVRAAAAAYGTQLVHFAAQN